MSESRRWRVYALRLLPWVFTLGVIAWILSQYSVADIYEEIVQNNAWAALLPAFCMNITVLITVAHWDGMIFRAAKPELGYMDVLASKASSSLLAVVGYSAGQGLYALWLIRKAKTGVSAAAGTMLFLLACDLCAVTLVGSVGTLLAVYVPEMSATAQDLVAAMKVVAPCIFLVVFVLLLLGPKFFGRFYERPGFWQVWAKMPRSHTCLTILGRAVNIGFIAFCTAWGLWSFGMDIPFLAVLALLPMILLVNALPINIAGLGPAQAAWLVFAPWAPEARILAFQLVWGFFLVMALIFRGAPFVRRFVRELGLGQSKETAQKTLAPPASEGESQTTVLTLRQQSLGTDGLGTSRKPQ